MRHRTHFDTSLVVEGKAVNQVGARPVIADQDRDRNMILHLDDGSLDITPMVLDRMNAAAAASPQPPSGR
jgi:hypothetical protein